MRHPRALEPHRSLGRFCGLDGPLRSRKIAGSKRLFKPRESFDRIVVVGRTGLESQLQIEAVSGGHGCRRGVEIDSLLLRGNGEVKNGQRERPAQRQSSRRRPNPQALQLPSILFNRGWHRAPGNESSRLALNMGHQAAAALFNVAERQTRGFPLKGTKTETCRTGLSNHESAVFEQKLSCLGE